MKKNLLKSCLVAIGLVAGTMGAWADDVYKRAITADEENNVKAWSADDLGDNAWKTTISDKTYPAKPVIDDKGLSLQGQAKDQEICNSTQINLTDKSIVTIDASWNVGGATGDAGNKTYFKIGNCIEFATYPQVPKGTVTIDGKENVVVNACGKNNGNRTDDIWNIHVVINTVTNIITELTVTGVNGTKKATLSLSNQTLSSASEYNYVSLGCVRKRNNMYTSLQSLMITEEKQSVETVNYTINYNYNGETVYSENSSSVLGAEITASSVVYDSDNNRYLTVAEECPTMVLKESGNVLNVLVRKPYSATLNINTVVSGESFASEKVILEETDDRKVDWVYTYPLYVQKDNKYYIADNKEKFGETGTFNDGDVINKTVSYTNEDKNVVFYAEAEGSSGVNINYSNGATGVVGAQNKRNRGIQVGSLAAGTYEFNAVLTANKTRALVVREMISDPKSGAENESEVNTAIVNSQIFGSLSNSTESVQFSLDKETKLVVNGANSGVEKTNQSVDFDYILIRQLSTPVTVSAAKYATYVTKYNVTVPADVKVYAVKVNEAGTGIVKTEVAEGTVVPASTGILVNAEEAGNYDFSVTNDDAQQLTDNELLASDGEGVTSDGETCYALGLLNGKVGFALVAKDVVIPAGKAYLKVSKASGAKFISMDGELTGINNVNIDTVAEKAPYYTLEGVKTLKPTKGVFIHNGKKVIIK